MKKLFLLILLFFWVTYPVSAQEIPLTVTPSLPPAPQVITYPLPYPGLLPDNPLYGLKVLRDRLVSIFITDPQQQATFDLLQADKRLSASMYLLQGTAQKEQLALDTISKAENYFFYAIENATIAKKQGEDINGFLGTMTTAAAKHEQILTGFAHARDKSFQHAVEQQEERVDGFVKQLDALKKA
ncbi:MAG TPA: hypothetical protein VGT05_04865 [Patescibacteria group bacterium]|nr:hypothetical protein [Patescibacteria group bacterium]